MWKPDLGRAVPLGPGGVGQGAAQGGGGPAATA
jgi:hypothetical protein